MLSPAESAGVGQTRGNPKDDDSVARTLIHTCALLHRLSTIDRSGRAQPARKPNPTLHAVLGRRPIRAPVNRMGLTVAGRQRTGDRCCPRRPSRLPALRKRGRCHSSLWQKSAIPARPDRSSFVHLTAMAMGKRPAARQASPMWVDTADLPTSDGHPFFERLNRVLEEAGFGRLRRGIVRGVLRCADGPPESTAGPVFPSVDHRLFRRVVLRAGGSRGGWPIR